MNYRLPALTLLLTLFGPWCYAESIQAVQGDVVEVRLNQQKEKPVLQCLGKTWPVMARTDHHGWRGWIGIDMRTRPGDYTCQWQSATDKQPISLHIEAGNFRISRITVKKSMAEFDAATLSRIRREVKALKATYRMHVEALPPIVMQRMPVQGVESTPFGAQRYVNGEPRSPHSGIDIAAAEGTPVQAPLAGRILYVSRMYLNGNTVVIGHGQGLVSVLSHLASTRVKTGDHVQTGDIIGTVGHTGRATGPHLHWSIRFREARVNPHSLLAPEHATP